MVNVLDGRVTPELKQIIAFTGLIFRFLYDEMRRNDTQNLMFLN